MEPRLALDMQVVLWLFAGAINQLSIKGKKLIANSNLCISPLVQMELQLLYEIGRTPYTAIEIVNSLANEIGLRIIDIQFKDATAHFSNLAWARDPFDRIIAATSAATGIPLLTKDKNILTNFDFAVC